jgi:hypothetical protein
MFALIFQKQNKGEGRKKKEETVFVNGKTFFVLFYHFFEEYRTTNNNNDDKRQLLCVFGIKIHFCLVIGKVCTDFFLLYLF